MSKWETEKLSDAAGIVMGQSPLSETYNENGEGFPFFQGKADFGIVYPKVRMFCNSPRKIAEINSILISVRAPVGSVNIAQERCCIGRGLAAISEKEKLSHYKYLFYYLRYKENDISLMGVGSTFKAIGKKDFDDIDIPLPPLEIQRRVANVLDRAAVLIEKRKTQIEKLDLLVKSRFVEMFGHEHEQERWTRKPIEAVADVTVGVVIKPAQYYTGRADGVRAFRSLNVGEMCVRDEDWVFFTPKGHSANKKSKLQTGDVLVVRSGYPGTSCVVTDAYAGCNAIDIIIARPKRDLVDPVFMCAFTNFAHGKNQIIAKTGGAAQQHFNVGAYKNMQIILPPLHRQICFAEFVQAIDKVKTTLRQSLVTLERNYNSLMQKCFRGEIF